MAALKEPYQISHAINSENQGLMITVVAAVLLVFSTLFAMLRLWVRWPWKSLFGFDDGVAMVAHAFGIVQTCVVFTAVQHGLGKKAHLLSSTQQVQVEKLIYASDLLFVIAVWLSRLAVAVMFLRLASNREQLRQMRYFVYTISALVAVSLLVVGLRQDTLMPWQDGLLSSTLDRWIAVGTLGAVVEIILVVFAVILVWKLQMQPRAKFRVVSGFAARLVVIAALAVRLVGLHSHVDASHFSFAFTMPALWTQLELHLCLICATVPCLRIFLKSFNTGYYGMTLEQLDPTGTMIATKGGDSFGMSNMKSGGSSRERHKLGNPTQSHASKSGMTTSRITHEIREDGESTSDRSDRGIFVKQTVNVAYDR